MLFDYIKIFVYKVIKLVLIFLCLIVVRFFSIYRSYEKTFKHLYINVCNYSKSHPP